MTDQPKLVYGSYLIALLEKEEASKIISLLEGNGITEWDTARIYPDSEKVIGELGVAKDAIIDTKARCFEENCLKREEVFKSMEQSLAELKLESVDIYYLHAPDKTTPIEETIDAIDELYKQRKFKRFGLSNFSVEEVKKIYDYAKGKGYVLPTVFQGKYNAFSRGIEKELFPVLRQLGISFYAYSPTGGGFLVKSVQQIERGSGRFERGTMVGDLYNSLYNKPTLLKGLERWGKIAEKHKIPKSHLAYRWLAFHSFLDGKKDDAVIIGGKNYQQTADTLDALKEGPLSESVVSEIKEIWDTIKDEAPTYDFFS